MKTERTVSLKAILMALVSGVTVLAIYVGLIAPMRSNVVTPSVDAYAASLGRAQDPQLKLLSRYEQALGYHFSREMVFITMPRTNEEAQSQAVSLAGTLHEYAHYKVSPLLIMEPTDKDGAFIDLNLLRTPQYSTAMRNLFLDVKQAGVTDARMGTLVPLPEADLPDWGGASTDPALFAQNYQTIGSQFKQVFPGAHLSLMLDSTTYPSGDTKHLNGDTSAAALLRYITALKQTPGMPVIDSLGFQGFPWTTSDNPQDYVNSTTAQSLAQSLGVRSIWLNTGTAQSYSGVTVSDVVRERQLLGELSQAKTLQSKGFDVRINIFGFHDADVNWVYPLSMDNQLTAPLPTFVYAASLSGIETDLFVSPE